MDNEPRCVRLPSLRKTGAHYQRRSSQLLVVLFPSCAGTWLHSLAEHHAPHVALPPLGAFVARSSPFSQSHTVAAVAAVDSSHDVLEETSSLRRASTRVAPFTESSAEPSASATDISRIKPSSYAMRPFSARKRPPAEPTFSVIYGAHAAPSSSSSRFPTLVQMNLASDSESADSAVAPLPSAATLSIAPSAPAPFVRLSSAPALPSQSKRSHRYDAPPVAATAPSSQPSIRSAVVLTIEAISQALRDHETHTEALQARIRELEQHRCASEPSSQRTVAPTPLSLVELASVNIEPIVLPPASATPILSTLQSNRDVLPVSPVSSAPRTATGPRPAFVVSTSVAHAPLSLGVTGVVTPPATAAKPATPSESYQARIARESEARRAAKEAERQAQLAAAQAAAAEAAERERKRREATKLALAEQKRQKAEQERARLEAEQAAAKAAKQKEKEATAKRLAAKEAAERQKKLAKTLAEEEAAAMAANVAAAEAARKKPKRASMTNEKDLTFVAATKTERTPLSATHEVVSTAALVLEPSVTPTPPMSPPPSAHATHPIKAKRMRAPEVVLADFASQTDFAPDDVATAAYIAQRFRPLSSVELAEEAQEAAELARLSHADQIAKLQLDLRYCKVRIRGLDEETVGQLQRLKQQKEELAKQASIIKEQNAELTERRVEDKKLYSTGLATELATPLATSSEEKSLTSLSADLPPSLASLLPPPPIAQTLASTPTSLAWLRHLFDHLVSLEKRRRDAERTTAETIEKGRMAEMNLLQVFQENERLQTKIALLQRRT